MLKDPTLYRPGVGIVLLNGTNHVFVAQRADKHFEAWQMPQGGIDEGEDPKAALWRELMEEAGTDKAEILREHPEWLYYDLPFDLQKKLWGGKFSGQKQKWFLLRFTGTDADININLHQPAEFTAWKWADPKDMLDMIVPFKRDVYREILREFRIV